MTEAEAIAKRIESFGAGRAFTAADFSDVAGRDVWIVGAVRCSCSVPRPQP